MSTSHKKALALLERALLRRGCVPRTIYVFKRTAQAFLLHAGKQVVKLTTDDVRRYLAARAASGIAATSQKAELVHLRSFCRVLVEAKVLAIDPTEGLDVRAPGHPPQLFLGERTVKAMLAAPFEPPRVKRMPKKLEVALALRTRACIEILYGLGLRAAEVAAIRVQDLRLAEGVLMIRRVKRGNGGSLPLPPASIPHLAKYLHEGRPVLVRDEVEDDGRFLLSRYGKPLTGKGVWVIVKLAAGKIGAKATPHAFRRTLATDLIRAGLTVESVRQVLGHTKLKTTAIYIDVSREELRKAVEALSLPE